MKIRLARPPTIGRLIYRGALFRISTTEKVLCLTFDDGPCPDSTPFLLDILEEQYNVKAVFFCNGRAAETYPWLMERIRLGGHLIGNHGYDHLDGWTTGLKEYCANAYQAALLTSDTLFRPPYGRIRPCQYKRLKRSFRVMFWDIMSFDFDKEFGAERSLKLLERKIRPGSVIVMHDTPSSSCLSFINDFIQASTSKGYRFELLT